MSELIFKKLHLEDFRVYQGPHDIEFSTDPSKKLTLVHAENSTGKTTMLSSIKWCLYGETPDFEDKTRLVNSRSKKNTCKVKLNFLFNDQEYQASRTYNQIDKIQKLILYKVDDHGAQIPETEGQAFINGLLPKELSNYFLFAGEQFAKEYIDQPENHRRAIRNILGFDLAERAIDDLGKIHTDNSLKIRALAKENKETLAASSELDRIEDKIMEAKEENKNHAKDFNFYEKEFSDAQKEIDKSDHKVVKSLSGELKATEASLKARIGELKEQFILKNGLISKYGDSVFGVEFGQISLDFINKQEKEHGLPSDYGQLFVNGLLKDEKCCCSRPLVLGSKEYNLVKNLINSATTDVINDRVRKAQNIGQHFESQSGIFLNKIKKIEAEVDSKEVNISSLEDSITQIKDELKGLNDSDVTGHVIRRDKASKEKIRSSSLIQTNLREIKRLKDSQIVHNKTIRTNPGKGEEFEKLGKMNQYIEKLLKIIKDQLDKTERAAVQTIKTNVQENIDHSMKAKFKVSVGDNYKINITTSQGHTIMGSDGGRGLTQLTSLSFVTALISHSKNRVNNKRTIFQPGTIAPFVIDAPFAEMDSDNQSNALRFLLTQSHQIILFLSSGQWEDAFENVVGPQIGKRYYFVDHAKEEGGATIKKLKIKEKEYLLSEYNEELSATEIKEIE